MRRLEEINLTGSLTYDGNRLPTQADIAELERRLKHPVPKDYANFLMQYNGGHPELGSIETAHGTYEESISHFLSLTIDDENERGVYKALKVWAPFISTPFIPIAADGGGNIFFIALDDGVVKMCIHDDRFQTKTVASSFSHLIDALGQDPEFI